MDEAVRPQSLHPLHLSPPQERFTKVAIASVDTKLHKDVTVIFVATSSGMIKKLGVLPRTMQTCLLEVWEPFSPKLRNSSRITELKYLPQKVSCPFFPSEALFKLQNLTAFIEKSFPFAPGFSIRGIDRGRDANSGAALRPLPVEARVLELAGPALRLEQTETVVHPAAQQRPSGAALGAKRHPLPGADRSRRRVLGKLVGLVQLRLQAGQRRLLQVSHQAMQQPRAPTRRQGLR